jgi:membrane-associated protease RseP (regulator of RpoE activity)
MSPVPEDAPPADAIEAVFTVFETRTDGDRLLYVGRPLAPANQLEREVWPVFEEYGYKVRLQQEYQPSEGPQVLPGNYVLVAEPKSVGVDGIPWTNIVFAVLTVLSTLFAGHLWYDIDVSGDPLAILQAWPFTVAVLGVLGIHELGHYVLSRYHGVDASLPYFIPFPTLFGTMGAVIKMKGRIPDREALFDIGVAGPLAGLAATIVVTFVGLHLDPVTISEATLNDPDAVQFQFNHPLLLQLLAELTGQPLSYADPAKSVNPVVYGGWIGMFITFLNLLPVGQLDGGHILRAMVGDRTETISAAVPAGLFGLAVYLLVALGGTGVGMWGLGGRGGWGLAYARPATPIRDEPLDQRRMAIGVLTFVLGVLCFTPVPLEVIPT